MTINVIGIKHSEHNSVNGIIYRSLFSHKTPMHSVRVLMEEGPCEEQQRISDLTACTQRESVCGS